MKEISISRTKWFILFFLISAGLTFVIGYHVRFHALSNDYWNILYYGRHMNLKEPASLYNGFYPFGYAFIIGQFPFTYILPFSYFLNAVLAGLLTASISTLYLYTRSVPVIIIAFFCSIASPFLFQAAITLSPDIGSASFTVFAVFLLWCDRIGNDDGKLNDLQFLLAGAFLGLSFLWRTHALVSAIAIIVSYFLFSGIRYLRSHLLILGAFLFFFLLQVAVNLISGHGPLETGQAFNLYKFFYGVDWNNPPPPSEIEKFSLMSILFSDPVWVWGMVKPFLYYYLSHLWAAALAFVLSPKGKYSRFALFLISFIFIYSIPFSFTDSERAPIIMKSIFMISVVLVLVVFMDRTSAYSKWSKTIQWAAGLFFVLVGFQTFYGWVAYDEGITRASLSEQKVLVNIERVLKVNGMKSPDEVFADRYDFYTPGTMPYRSQSIGTWTGDWFWGYKLDYPPLPNGSWEVFRSACEDQAIRFLVLSPNSGFRGDFLPEIYDGNIELDSLGLVFIGQRGNMKIFMLQ